MAIVAQRQDAAARRLQRRRDAARARRRRAGVPARGCCARCASAGVELRVDGRTRALAGPALAGDLRDASDEDWDTEFLALVLAVGVVDSVDEAIEHVNAPRLRALARRSSPRDTARGAGVRARRRRGVRLRQRVDAVHRRRRVRDGRRDRQLDAEAARARADRAARAVHASSTWSRATATSGLSVIGDARVGILGGTFNPPHLGHLICAQEARGPARARPRAADAGARAAAQGGRARTRARRCGSSCAELAVAGDERLEVSRARGRARRRVVHGGYPEGAACARSGERADLHRRRRHGREPARRGGSPRAVLELAQARRSPSAPEPARRDVIERRIAELGAA